MKIFSKMTSILLLWCIFKKTILSNPETETLAEQQDVVVPENDFEKEIEDD